MLSPDSPVSAFSVYKKSKRAKNGRARKRKSNKLFEIHDEIATTKKPKMVITENKPLKKSEQIKPKKQILLLKESRKPKIHTKTIFHSNSDKDDQPPKLIPIPSIVKNSKSEKTKKANKVEKNKMPQKLKIPNLLENVSNKLTDKDVEENPIKDGFQLFEWLINPLTPSVFLEKYWEKKPVHIKCNDPSKRLRYSKSILSSSQLDTMFRDHPLYYNRNVDVVTYENDEKVNFNQEGRAVASALWDYYLNGCSIRVINPHSFNKKVQLLITTLQEYFGSMVGANVYLTPPGSQGFAPHYDDIEAFIVQLEGRKHWMLYKPKGSDVLARDSSHNFKREELDKPFMEVILEAGDLLYFPRGVIHEGRTDEGAHSLHITVSVYQHNAYVDLLEHILPKALKDAAQNDVNFRRGLPLHYLQHLGEVNKDTPSEIRNKIITNVDTLMKSLLKYVDVDKAADQLGRKLMHDSMPPVPSLSEIGRSVAGDGERLDNGVVHNRVEIGLDTSVRLLRYHCIRLVSTDDSSFALYYNTENANYYHGLEEQQLEIDAANVPLIKYLQNTFPKYVEIEKIPGDTTKNLQVISDLWEMGIIITEEPLMTIDSDNEDSTSENSLEEDDSLEFIDDHIDENIVDSDHSE